MAETQSNPDLRVILVGRTGLDASLRLDPGIELVRVRTALAAVGELSDPIDPAVPTSAIVIVGPDAEPEPTANGQPPNGHAGHRDEFITALRLIDPAVRVLRAVEPGARFEESTARGYDALVDADQPADSIRALLRARSAGAAPTAPPAPVAPVAPPAPPPPALSPAPAPAFSPTPGGGDAESARQRGSSPAPIEPATVPTAFGDAALARVLLRGGDLIMPAVGLIRARTRDEGVQFVRRGQPLPEIVLAVPVSSEAAEYGHLWSDRTLPEELRLHADWLALWLRLGEQQAQLREAAFTDPLTGAWNRRYFDRYLTAAIDRARALRQPVTVMVFDIDDFKRFNDRYGHAAADEILVETVRLLSSVIRPSDKVCRIGGDEFAVIFHEPGGPRKPGSAPPATVFEIAARFQEQVRSKRFPKLGGDAPGTLTVSGGLASFPWDGQTPDELIRRADALAIESKRAGKNAIVYGPGGPTL